MPDQTNEAVENTDQNKVEDQEGLESSQTSGDTAEGEDAGKTAEQSEDGQDSTAEDQSSEQSDLDESGDGENTDSETGSDGGVDGDAPQEGQPVEPPLNPNQERDPLKRDPSLALDDRLNGGIKNTSDRQ